MELSAMPVARLDQPGLAHLRAGATMVRTRPAVFRIEGSGAVACLQGLVTNDLEAPGPGSLTYNALLTPKGMIVLDLWVLRDDAGFTLLADATASQEALALFARTLPPRLARLTDRSGEWEVLWLVGGAAPERLAGLMPRPLPAPGRVAALGDDTSGILVAAGTEAAWFEALLVGPAGAVERLAGNLRAADVVEGTENERVAARVLAGWPALGAEIGEKTLPQEVRFDEIGGVSYTKGCYLGQETVARVHFRGHPNRELRGLAWSGTAPLTGDAITFEGKGVGSIRSVLEVPGRRLALALMRREVEFGSTVSAGGHPAEVVPLPFGALLPAA